MASETDKPNFFFYLILVNLNGHVWLVATLLDSTVREPPTFKIPGF